MSDEIFILDTILLISIFIFIFVVSFRKSSKYRKRIKERVNRKFNEENEPSSEELKDRLSELELEYEELEQENWLVVGVSLCLMSYLYWHLWYISLFVGLAVFFIGWKYIAIRPFTNGIPDHQQK